MSEDNHPDIVPLEDHYVEAGLDYEYWSSSFNMHFGFWRQGLNPFSREAMLKELTSQVANRMDCPEYGNILDMGCGLGAPLRDMGLHHPNAQLTGVTRVSWQIEQARKMTLNDLEKRTQFIEADFTQIPLPDHHFDSIYAMEAICHLPGLSKIAAIKEAARLLKPGAKLVIADGFLLQDKAPWPLDKLFTRVANDWALETFASLPQFCHSLGAAGLEFVSFENISLRIGPSALHTPFVSLKWLLSEIRKDGKITSARWRHVKASLLAPLVGLAFPWFGYGLITAQKPK